MKRIFLNETGQMTVFVALIFQVLFVFFAMVINIGLLVHDKINLQNAVDLGAYYGAQRQAEILNEIAHINYQIRQDNKLLAWRYWVLGTLGRNGGGDPPGASTGITYPANTASSDIPPSICVFNNFWLESKAATGTEENYCYRPYGNAGAITRIPKLVIIAPFVPGVINAGISIGNLRDLQGAALVNQGPLNWAVGSLFIFSYKMAITARKAVIQKLRANLVSPTMVDQQAQSVRDGVFQTIRKNLTVANLNSLNENDFDFRNGLATPACAGARNDGDPTIKEIRTTKGMFYTYSTLDPDNATVDVSPIFDTKFAPGFEQFDPSGMLRQFSSTEYSTGIDNSQIAGLNASSLGFEKNPWCMAYVAVHAKSTPRKPFAPFGQPVELVARSFAQPFGGRVGPWHRSRWAQSAEMSSGDRVDPIATPRLVGDANEAGEPAFASLPNYGRYPGDQLGIRDLNHQAGFRNLVRSHRRGAGPNQLSALFFTGSDQLPKHGDPLAWDYSSQNQTQVSPLVARIRQAEEGAVAPDLFDATYYSIDLNYPTNYKAKNLNGTRFTGMPSQFGNTISVPPDIGGRNGSSLEGFTVQQQIQVANDQIDSVLKGALGYMLSSPDHVLTSWAPVNNSNFGFPTQRFAKCDGYATKAQYMIPGVCTNGGRVGYSVRIISRDHLISNKWDVGGGGEKGTIRNPPSPDF